MNVDSKELVMGRWRWNERKPKAFMGVGQRYGILKWCWGTVVSGEGG